MNTAPTVLVRRQSAQRPPLNVLIIENDPEERAKLHNLLKTIDDPSVEIREASSEEPIARVIAGTDVVVVVEKEGGLQISKLARVFETVEVKPKILALVSDTTPSVLRNVLRAGADEVVSYAEGTSALTRTLLKLDETRTITRQRTKGFVCSLVSVSGGVGVTTLTSHLALAAKVLEGKKAAIVDFDFQSAGMCTALSVEPENTIIELAKEKQKIDSIALEGALSKSSSGLYLLAAPSQIEQHELINAELVQSILSLMRELFDTVWIDCGHHIDERAVVAWEASDCLLYVLDQSVAALHGAIRFLSLFKRLDITGVEPRLVINKYSRRELISESQAANVVGQPIFAHIPDGSKLLRKCFLQNRHVFDIAPSSALARSYGSLMAKLTGWGAQKERTVLSGLFKKLLAPNGRG